MARYHGRRGVVYLAPSGGATAANTVIGLTTWSLDQKTDKAEVTAFGDTNKVYVQGLPDLTGSISGFWDDTEDTLFSAAGATAAVRMYLYPSADVPTKYWYGTAWIDASIETGVGDAVAVSGDFVAGGVWARK